MTVKELRAILAHMPGDSTVLIEWADGETGEMYWSNPMPKERILNYDRRDMEWYDDPNPQRTPYCVVVL